MNIFLVPYTWARHVSTSLMTGSAALLVWWFMLFLTVIVRPAINFGFSQGFEGAALLGFTSAVIAATSMLTEMSLRREGPLKRFGLPILVALIALIFTWLSFGMAHGISRIWAGESGDVLASDSSYVTFRFRFLQWAAAGFCAGLAPLTVRLYLYRRWAQLFDHLGGGIASGAIGGAVWHMFGYFGFSVLGTHYLPPDLYLAPALGLFAWGFSYGLLTWGVPDELYAAWMRILSTTRFGHRIPIDRVLGGGAERFVGHFPRGLDVHIPADKAVAELHVSFVTNGQSHYVVRGLSQQPTMVKRFLERVDLRYDPRRPAPLETDLKNEDVVLIGPNGESVVEFILLPKEES